MESCIYEGRVRHSRSRPARHQFSYRLFLMYLDMDELETLFEKRWFWSSSRPALARFRRGDHIGPEDQPLAEAVQELGANACTDITGYGFIGHAMEVAKASNKTLSFNFLSIPFFEEALEYASDGFVPGGALNNRNYYHADVSCEGEIASELMDVFYDPQTSGGLLVTLDVSKKESFMNLCKEKGVSVFHVGEVLRTSPGNIILRD